MLAGIYNLAFAGFHLAFWRLFGWERETARMTPVNAAILQVINLCLALMFVLAGAACLFFPTDLIGTDLGHFLLFAMAGFWLFRLILQPMYFGFRNAQSRVITLVFAAGVVLHFGAWIAAVS
jgi:hypothetical protein